ncbi:universal stress protein [Aquisalimonas sp.]|uniref:universal stress protein n=1 Tax=Aquisalimonas sp. TaxID=1872621 RepID=UPI0025BE7AFF|nr:universal stress protein [Aquisalimonas sp.]
MALQQYEKVIVPLDGSENGFRALRHAAALAQVAQLEVHLLHVFPVGSAELMDLLHYPSIAKAKAEGELRHAREEEGSRIFPAAHQLVPAGVSAQEVMLSGDPANGILEYAQSHPEAMIVMGTRGHSEVRELLVGSVTNKVVHHAHCPVTVIH